MPEGTRSSAQLEGAVAYTEEKDAGDASGAPVGGGGADPGFPAQDGVKNQADQHVADSGHGQGRERFNGDANAEVGGAP